MGADDFKIRSLTFIKAMGKTLAQMSLYTLKHPTVLKSITDNHQALEVLLREAREFSLSVDKDQLLVNGKLVGGRDQVPSALFTFFKRFELHGVTFLPGTTMAELAAFYEAMALKTEALAGKTFAAYLEERGVRQIRPNAAVYVKVEKKDDEAAAVVVPGEGGAGEGSGDGAGAGQGAGETDGEQAGGAGAGAGAGAGSAEEEFEKLTVQQAVQNLVRKAVPDPSDQARVQEILKRKLREDMEKRVAEATAVLQREKNLLSNEKARTDLVLNNMSEAVVLVDDKGDVLLMNQAAESLYGKNLAEMAGKPLVSAGKPEEQVVTLAEDIRTPRDRPVTENVVQWGNEETSRALKAAAAVVRNEQGSVVGLVTGLPDAAKFRELQRVQDEFIANVTHELRSPLTSISAALSLLQQQFVGKLGPDEARTLSVASRNAERLGSLINDILDFSKLEAGQMTVHPVAMEVEPALKDAVLGLEAWAKTKKVELRVLCAQGLPRVLADPKRFTQVVVNLLSNAIKFSPAGTSVDVRAQDDTQETGFVRYAVTDHGPGMSQEDTAKLFGKFVQLMAGEKQAVGTGLGLSIAKALVHLQKGRIWVQSMSGAGTTFFFTLPEVKEEMAAEAPKTEAPPPPTPWWKKLFGKK